MSDDFKIIDSFEENDTTKKKKKSIIFKNSKTVMIVIVIILSLLIGIGVFVGSNALFNKGKKKEKEPTTVQLDLKNENVDILYHYVTYGTRNKRYEKFIKNKSVTLKDFTNEEKLYYALQFAQVEDFVFTKKYNEKDQKIYSISKLKMDDYMKRFFGAQVTYTTDDTEITYPFSFRINGQNVGTLKYSKTRKGYETVFDGFQDDIKSTDIVEPYYAKLTRAEQNLDNTIVLTEKIIYTTVEEENGLYNITIYKDYDKTKPIEKRTGITLEQLQNNPIKIDNYLANAGTIQYKFDINISTYYFASSKIIN